MKRIREALRFHQDCNMSLRKTANALSISRPALTEYLKKCAIHKLTYENIKNLSDEKLLELFFTEKATDPRMIVLEKIFPYIAKELGRVGMTRALLWEELLSSFVDKNVPLCIKVNAASYSTLSMYFSPLMTFGINVYPFSFSSLYLPPEQT